MKAGTNVGLSSDSSSARSSEGSSTNLKFCWFRFVVKGISTEYCDGMTTP